MEYTTLNNGVKMPVLGYGVYQIAPRECERCVSDAIRTGYRSIDTAQCYGNEEGVGNAVRKSGLPRREFFITTKVWTSGFENTRCSIDLSLRKLQSDYIDLLLIHQPSGNDAATYRAMEEALRAGKVRAIGLSNFYGSDFTAIVRSSAIVPAVNQVETHVFWQQKPMREFLKQYGTQIESWSPLAEGLNGLFQNPVLTAVARRYGRSVAQVVLRFLLQNGIVVIPKSTHRERMQENFDVFGFELDADAMTQISELDKNTTLFFWP